jgi:hypothetical protein
MGQPSNQLPKRDLGATVLPLKVTPFFNHVLGVRQSDANQTQAEVMAKHRQVHDEEPTTEIRKAKALREVVGMLEGLAPYATDPVIEPIVAQVADATIMM